MTIKAKPSKRNLIGGTLSTDIFEKLEQFKKDNNLSTSGAVAKIIEWYMKEHPEYLDKMAEHKEQEND